MKDSFCSFCGTGFPATRHYPKKCHVCHQITYFSAPCVGVGLIPINGGLLCIRRGISPHTGELALPGGYKGQNETWEEGIVREVFEETGVMIEAGKIELVSALTADNDAVLLFGICPPITVEDTFEFQYDEVEIQDVLILESPQIMAFPHHTTMVTWFFAEGINWHGVQ